MNQQLIQIIEDNLHQVWNERDAEARLKTIERIYATDATLYHFGDQVTGHDAINESVTAVQQSLPPGFEFTLLKPVLINHDIGRAIWGAGPKGQSPVSTGMDIARLEDGKIKSLYVFLES
ncbi:nuclear transport factor 2 family protein [Mucilaginibacter sp. JRF]|uniref:nuclear transport factor 2 family protein n=1 Tax=Mucilaginibacter sp. JRF TaxID=2780088 RepID=UPI00187F2633|nr:nuclear transport factor 2 family protein [Mucilaginibacter sp. JRF]MBE9586408.1 nuclear transport factor 2 family protein [Mucilaginibacter sp. JRF]